MIPSAYEYKDLQISNLYCDDTKSNKSSLDCKTSSIPAFISLSPIHREVVTLRRQKNLPRALHLQLLSSISRNTKPSTTTRLSAKNLRRLMRDNIAGSWSINARGKFYGRAPTRFRFSRGLRGTDFVLESRVSVAETIPQLMIHYTQLSPHLSIYRSFRFTLQLAHRQKARNLMNRYRIEGLCSLTSFADWRRKLREACRDRFEEQDSRVYLRDTLKQDSMSFDEHYSLFSQKKERSHMEDASLIDAMKININYLVQAAAIS